MKTWNGRTLSEGSADLPRISSPLPRIELIPVGRIRPEEGLGRKRDRQGHSDLCRSVEKFGVLTPITVRRADDGTSDFLLIKGQGRTLACRQLGLEFIPGIVLESVTEAEKVQHFLLENVARLKMRPIDRALLISRARGRGEETSEVARRFGVTAATVRRLEAQLLGVSGEEALALLDGRLNLTVQAKLAKYVPATERAGYIQTLISNKISANDLELLFSTLKWHDLVGVGEEWATSRVRLFQWAIKQLTKSTKMNWRDRLIELAIAFPTDLETKKVAAR